MRFSRPFFFFFVYMHMIEVLFKLRCFNCIAYYIWYERLGAI